MKNKNTKQMWIYASVLFIVALALILVTTLTQWKLILENNNLQVLDSFTQNSNQRIEQLTNETVVLKNQLLEAQHNFDDINAKYTELQTQYEALKSDKAFLDASNAKVYSLVNAYINNNKTAVKEQLKNFSKEELDAILPGFYDKANKL